MNFILWIIFGALAGWIASIIMGNNRKMGAIANIVTGIVGAFIGGWVMSFFGAQGGLGKSRTILRTLDEEGIEPILIERHGRKHPPMGSHADAGTASVISDLAELLDLLGIERPGVLSAEARTPA